MACGVVQIQIQFCPSIQKLFMVFFNTDGYGRKFFYTPFFLPLSKRVHNVGKYENNQSQNIHHRYIDH